VGKKKDIEEKEAGAGPYNNIGKRNGTAKKGGKAAQPQLDHAVSGAVRLRKGTIPATLTLRGRGKGRKRGKPGKFSITCCRDCRREEEPGTRPWRTKPGGETFRPGVTLILIGKGKRKSVRDTAVDTGYRTENEKREKKKKKGRTPDLHWIQFVQGKKGGRMARRK